MLVDRDEIWIWILEMSASSSTTNVCVLFYNEMSASSNRAGWLTSSTPSSTHNIDENPDGKEVFWNSSSKCSALKLYFRQEFTVLFPHRPNTVSQTVSFLKSFSIFTIETIGTPRFSASCVRRNNNVEEIREIPEERRVPRIM